MYFSAGSVLTPLKHILIKEIGAGTAPSHGAISKQHSTEANEPEV